MYDFLQSAEQAHTTAGYNFPSLLDHYWSHEYVIKTPSYFMMRGRDPVRSDAWLVWWAEMHPNKARRDFRNMLRDFMQYAPFPKPWIGWSRPLKGRNVLKYYSTDRLVRLMTK